MKWLKTASLLLAASVALGACSNTEVSQYSPEQVIENALQHKEEITTYYGEYDMKMEDETVKIKEWRDGKDVRIETAMGKDEAVSVMKDNEMRLYDKTKNELITMDISTANDELPFSAQKTIETTLNMIKDTHDITLVGEEKYLKRDTYHIKAIAKKEGLIGDSELWIDKKTWVPLKSLSEAAGETITINYTTFEPNAKMPSDIFTLDVPKDVTVKEIPTEMAEEELTLEQAQEIYPTMLLSQQENVTIERITVLPSVNDRQEVTIDYSKDGAPYMSITTFKDEVINDEPLMEGEEEVTVQGVAGTYVALKEFKVLTFAKDALHYSVMPLTSDATKEDILQFSNELQ